MTSGRNPVAVAIVATVQEILAAATTDRCVVHAGRTGEGWRFAATVVRSDGTETTTSVTVADSDVVPNALPQNVARVLARNLGIDVVAPPDADLQADFDDDGYTGNLAEVVDVWRRIAFMSARIAVREVSDSSSGGDLHGWARSEIADLRAWAENPSAKLSVYEKGGITRMIVGPLATAWETLGWYQRQTGTDDQVRVAVFLADKLEAAMDPRGDVS